MNQAGWIGPLSEMLLQEIQFTVFKRYSVIETKYIAESRLVLYDVNKLKY
jgi:hypothetical protein